MNFEDFLSKIDEQSLAKKIIFLLVLYLAVSWAIWSFWCSDLSKNLNELTEERDTLKAKIIKEKKLIKVLPAVKEEVKKLQVQLNYVMQQLPDKKEIPSLLSQISSLANDAGLTVLLFKPTGEIKRDFYAEVPVALKVEGSFHQILSFFDDVAHLPRIVNVKNISMGGAKKDKQGNNILTTTCLVTTFRYLEEGERIKAKKGKKKRKRRKRE
ncbi:MAG: pilus assembly protein PilO [Candidatus Dadabacteria bacterium]|nr:MAG: pilus assembly protein PilO [Candidatus Dadabacteria bacterium]